MVVQVRRVVAYCVLQQRKEHRDIKENHRFLTAQHRTRAIRRRRSARRVRQLAAHLQADFFTRLPLQIIPEDNRKARTPFVSKLTSGVFGSQSLLREPQLILCFHMHLVSPGNICQLIARCYRKREICIRHFYSLNLGCERQTLIHCSTSLPIVGDGHPCGASHTGRALQETTWPSLRQAR